VSFVLSFIFAILLQLNLIDETAFSDFMKTMAFSAGGFIGIAYEIKKINFSVEGSKVQKVLRVLVLVLGMLIIQYGLKLIFVESIYYIGAFIRYLIVGLWLTALFPLIFKKLFP
ncbi:MAG: phosphoesterase PA-phosphatase, partial [Sphaerochaetaceae bacterium]|nr:phosphoesterase PA-phosphatase [Sphaerochaetaceae bacterium]